MKGTLKIFSFLLVVFFFGNSCAQKQSDLKIYIYQNASLKTVQYGYEIENNTIRVFEEHVYSNSGDYTEVERIGIYNKELESSDINSIIDKINSLGLFELDSSYSKPKLDGILWNFELSVNQKSKTIRL